MSRLAELRELTRVRVYAFLREPEAVFWVFVFPLVLAVVLGLAFRSARPAPSLVAVAPGEGSAALVEALGASDGLEVEPFQTEDAMRVALRRGAIDAIVEPAPGGGEPILHIDTTRTEGETARLRIVEALAAARGAPLPEPVVREQTEKGSRYIDFLFPGLIGMNLMGTGMWGIGFALADTRQKKLLRRMLVTPMRRGSFFLSFMLSRLVFLTLELAIVAGFGAWVLGVPFRGTLVAFALVSTLGALTFAGLGVLTVSRARTIEGASGLMNFVMMPMWLASGVFFSYERFPDVTIPFIKLLPLTALNDALRNVMLDGASVVGQGRELLILAVWGAVSFLVAVRIFRWE
ncbi:MAG: ABC transporter permease [Planctomycetota bacterium]|nr:MAG: ABC transporter permease [Planctomycetota bacterium]